MNTPTSRTWHGLEPLEQRDLCSAVIDSEVNRYVFNDADGDQVTVTLKGPGSATITLQDQAMDRADIQSIVLSGTQASTSLTMKVKRNRVSGGDGQTTLRTITGPGLGKLDLRPVSVTGDGLNITGSVKELRLAELREGADLILGDSNLGLNLDLLAIRGSDLNRSRVLLPGGVKRLAIKNAVQYADFDLGEQARTVQIGGEALDLTIAAGTALSALSFKRGVVDLALTVGEVLTRFDAGGPVTGLRAVVGESVGRFTSGSLSDSRLQAGQRLDQALIRGDILDQSVLAASSRIGNVQVRGVVQAAWLLAGVVLDTNLAFQGAVFALGVIDKLVLGGDVSDSIISAGGNPGDDRLFAATDLIFPGSRIANLLIRGRLVGTPDAVDINPGVYADELGKVRFEGRLGTAVI